MIITIRDSLSDHVSSDHGEDGEDEKDAETEEGKLSKDDEHSWVMGKITKTVQQLMERFWQLQMTLDQWIQLGLEDAAEYLGERDKKYGTSELTIPAVVKP